MRSLPGNDKKGKVKKVYCDIPYVGIIQIKLKGQSDTALSQPALRKLPCQILLQHRKKRMKSRNILPEEAPQAKDRLSPVFQVHSLFLYGNDGLVGGDLGAGGIDYVDAVTLSAGFEAGGF